MHSQEYLQSNSSNRYPPHEYYYIPPHIAPPAYPQSSWNQYDVSWQQSRGQSHPIDPRIPQVLSCSIPPSTHPAPYVGYSLPSSSIEHQTPPETSRKRLERTTSTTSSTTTSSSDGQKKARSIHLEQSPELDRRIFKLTQREQELSNKVELLVEAGRSRDEIRLARQQWLEASRERLKLAQQKKEATITELTTNLSLSEDANQSLKTENQALSLQIGTLRVEIACKQKQIQKLSDDCSYFSAELESLSEESQLSISSLKLRIAELQTQNEILEQEKQGNAQEISRLITEAQTNQQSLEAKDDELLDMNAKLLLNLQEIATLVKKNEELTASIEQVQKTMKSQTETLNKLSETDKARAIALASYSEVLNKISAGLASFA